MDDSQLILPILLASLPILILIFITLCTAYKKCNTSNQQIA